MLVVGSGGGLPSEAGGERHGDVFGHGCRWPGGGAAGGAQVVQVVGGGGRVGGVLGPVHVAHAVPDPHVVELPVNKGGS